MDRGIAHVPDGLPVERGIPIAGVGARQGMDLLWGVRRHVVSLGDRQIDGWVDGWMNRWIDRWIAHVPGGLLVERGIPIAGVRARQAMDLLSGVRRHVVSLGIDR